VATGVEELDWSTVDAVLFDLDGVITPTAEVHMHAWAEMFTAFLEDRHVAPYTAEDYFAHVDGKPRYEGVAALLASRGLDVPWGDPTDTPDTDTICGLGNRKNELFGIVLERDGVQAYPGSVELLDALDARGTRMAIVSSSANAPDVLRAAGLLSRFETVVDGVVARERRLPGKPRPDTYEFAADALGVPHDRAAVVEDAVSGVEAGAAGDFAVVVGVDRGAGADTLLAHGADLVVEDLAELVQGVQAPTAQGAR
jgi:beta-phosphoglucomutase family hydrolase